jgi:hypothetical protein
VLYDLNFLRQGDTFPPKSEIRRLEGYRVNALLLDDEAWSALPYYRDRVLYLLSSFALPSKDVYFFSANYWADLVQKTQELTYGEAPEFETNKENELMDVLERTDFIEKSKEGCADFVALGDWVTKIVENENGVDFINVNPSTWYPIVSRENVKEVVAHVLAWVVPVGKDRFELHAQIHERGRYTNKAFAIKDYNADSYYLVEATKQRIQCPTYEIGKELEESATDFSLGVFETGLDGFAIIASANNPGTRRICGISDFDSITDAAMEYNVRMTLKNVVLDKHAAPKLYGPPLDGESSLGNYLEVPDGGVTPNYLVWDASMAAVENTIQGLKDDIANLSGMGSLLNSKTFGASQGYDALMIKLAPALMRSSRKKAILERHLKKLISTISVRYGGKIDEKDISVLWHDGIPTTETVRADIARKHLDTGWSFKRVLMDDYGFTEEDAEAIIEERRLEQPAIPSFGMDDSFDMQGGEDV